MQKISLFNAEGGPVTVLALGAHADDIEIGCGGTILRLASEIADLEMIWVVFCATSERSVEAQDSAASFLQKVNRKRVLVHDHHDGYLSYNGAAIKDEFESLKRECTPNLIFTHFREDRHQDHRLISELTWNTWRNHLILEYEIPKYDGDLGSPNFFSRLDNDILERKLALILRHFPSQRDKHWFSAELLRGLARIRGVECATSDGFAEGFYCRKLAF
jgi:LmbE family N-acetylglucosaminyl deacetylase